MWHPSLTQPNTSEELVISAGFYLSRTYNLRFSPLLCTLPAASNSTKSSNIFFINLGTTDLKLYDWTHYNLRYCGTPITSRKFEDFFTSIGLDYPFHSQTVGNGHKNLRFPQLWSASPAASKSQKFNCLFISAMNIKIPNTIHRTLRSSGID